MSPEMIVIEVTLWDRSKIEALMRKIEGDARVMAVKRIDGE